MKYSFRRVGFCYYEILRERDKKIVGYLVRGIPHHWWVVSADRKKIFVDAVPSSRDAKVDFEAYAKTRRGQI